MHLLISANAIFQTQNLHWALVTSINTKVKWGKQWNHVIFYFLFCVLLLFAAVFPWRSWNSFLHSRTCLVALIPPNVLAVFEVTPVCVAGGQLDQWGAKCRRSAGGALQRSDYSSGRGGSGRRGQVCVAHPPHHSSVSICRLLSAPLFHSSCFSLSCFGSFFAMLWNCKTCSHVPIPQLSSCSCPSRLLSACVTCCPSLCCSVIKICSNTSRHIFSDM